MSPEPGSHYDSPEMDTPTSDHNDDSTPSNKDALGAMRPSDLKPVANVLENSPQLLSA